MCMHIGHIHHVQSVDMTLTNTGHSAPSSLFMGEEGFESQIFQLGWNEGVKLGWNEEEI